MPTFSRHPHCPGHSPIPVSLRNPWIDQVKALANLLIVGHHLAFYGPMADVVWPVLPALMEWLYTYARMAVQVFLVLGGYLAAAALAPRGVARHARLMPVLGKRYVRLALPYCAALVIAIAVNEGVRSLGFEHDSVSASPTWAQVLAHLLLMHSIGGWESLSAGVWYVAIDFQLYALVAVWFWLCQRAFGHRTAANSDRPMTLAQAGVVCLAAGSLWAWNLDADLDVWALYFLGAYGLGMMAWWAQAEPASGSRQRWLALMLACGGVALLIEWRARIALALVAALLLAIAGAVRWPQAVRGWRWPALDWVGQRSYSVFLIHFPVCLLVNALWARLWPADVAVNALGLGLAMAASVAAGALLYRTVESRTATWQRLLGWQAGAMGMAALAVTRLL